MSKPNPELNGILDNIKSFYNDDSNKITKTALVLIAGSLVAYAAYNYTKNNEKSFQNEEISNDDDEKESKEDIERKKARKAAKAAKKAEDEKKKKELEPIINDIIQETSLIIDNKGWNMKYFMNYYSIGEWRKDFLRFQCKSCNNICRDCVEIEEDGKDDEEDPTVMCEVCAIVEKKKYKPYKTFRKMILKEEITLPDPKRQDIIQYALENEVGIKDSFGKDTIFTVKIFRGLLSKCINRKLPKLAQKRLKQKADAEEKETLLEKGVITNLDWKFYDKSNTKEPLFFVSDDGFTATTNKRSGTVFFGPVITALKYRDKEWVNNNIFAGNYYIIELKINEADGCGIGFCQRGFNQFVGKNEGQINSMMLNQTGWFYTSRTFKHEWEHSRESPMGKWFQSHDIIVMVIDCRDAINVKAEIYKKSKPDNKFEIEKLPKDIRIAVNVIVGSNPKGSVNPQVTVVSATVERKV